MSDAITRLNAALEGRYAIERELADDLKHERKVRPHHLVNYRKGRDR